MSHVLAALQDRRETPVQFEKERTVKHVHVHGHGSSFFDNIVLMFIFNDENHSRARDSPLFQYTVRDVQTNANHGHN